MNICGIVTEYNPMHLGHAYQLKKAVEVTDSKGTVLVMSGNFVQRGTPAIIDKYARGRAAIESGIDLVLELPTYFATSSAEYFSDYAIRLLHNTGVVTHLNFGSESGSIDALKSIGSFLAKEPLDYKVLLNNLLKEGYSYPKARELAIKTYNHLHKTMPNDVANLLTSPNNILGIEYIKALCRLNSKIIPTTIQRMGAHYHDDNSESAMPSATSLRASLKDGNTVNTLKSKMPTAAYSVLKHALNDRLGPIYPEDIYPYLRAILLRSTPKELRQYVDVSEGLENRIIQAANTTHTYGSFLSALKTKRYTNTRLSRALLHIYLGHTKVNFDNYYSHMKPYLKVLAFSSHGQSILKAIKAYDEDLPIIVNNRQGYKKLDPLQRQCFLADLNSTTLYNHLITMKYGSIPKHDYQVKITPFLI